MTSPQRVIVGIFGLVLLVVGLQAVLPDRVPPLTEPEVKIPCRGEPIRVDFAYSGTINDPWTCKEQCDDDKPRYILYTNGKATQCGDPPSCFDAGEDSGTTCEPGVGAESRVENSAGL